MRYWFLPTRWLGWKSTCFCYDGCCRNRRHRHAGAAGCWSSAGAAATTNATCGRRWRATGTPAPPGLLTGTWRRQTAFGRQDAQVRERLLTLLLDTPPGLLEQFGLLAPLLQELADRLSFLCSWVLELFLDPETPRHSEADHLEVALDVLLQKLAEEVERLREICSRPAYLCLHEVLCDYRDHLLRRAVVGEHEDLE